MYITDTNGLILTYIQSNKNTKEANGYSYKLHYKKPNLVTKDKSRKRNISWYNPPYDRNVKSKIGKEFLKILDKCFPASNKLHKIFNQNTVKISYSCMPSVKTIIEGNNKKILRNSEDPMTVKKCSSPKNATCPLDGERLASDIVYRATVTCSRKLKRTLGWQQQASNQDTLTTRPRSI